MGKVRRAMPPPPWCCPSRIPDCGRSVPLAPPDRRAGLGRLLASASPTGLPPLNRRARPVD
eukprot:6716936-Prymnesium_polylepis.1